VDSLGNQGTEHVLSRTENDCASRLTPCPGGYAVIGTTTPTSTRRDAWLLRTDEIGDTLWTRAYGGDYVDAGIDIALIPDSGFIIAGYTYSFSGQPGTRRDAWLVRTDARGDTLWTRTFAGPHNAGGTFSSVRLMPDNGFLMGGTDNANDGDGWIVQTDSLGYLVWQGTWGDITEQNWDHITYARPTEDGGCIAFGCSYTYSTPSFDAWMLKIDSLCTTGISQPPQPSSPARIPPISTVVRGSLLLPRTLDPSGQNGDRPSGRGPVPALRDIAGRRVMSLHPGPNDISLLSPGIYFMRSAESDVRSAVSKFIVQH
jgi:hypothetical protein